MLGYYAFEAEAFDPEKQRYINYDGVFRMEVDRTWEEHMARATMMARSDAAAFGLDPATVTNVFICWLVEDEDIEEEESEDG